MARKVIIDCDMGADDAVALSMALFDSRLDVLAVTASEGCVDCEQASHNLQAIIGQLDPDRYPRLGYASVAENAPAINTAYLYGKDGLGNADFPASRLQHVAASEKVIIDLVKANPSDITILCLGPLTNIAKAFQRDPTLPGLVDRLVITGGCLDGVGNITPAAEFNFYFDPESARQVVRSRTTKTLIPLDVTRRVTFGLDFLEQLPSVDTRVGHFLHQVLPYLFRSFRQRLGHEEITLNDAVGLMALLEPSLFECEDMACDVETQGELTRGATVFDRRIPAEWPVNMEAAIGIRHDVVRRAITDHLTAAGLSSPR